MKKVLIAYFSLSGNTQKMAEYMAEGVRISGQEVAVKKVSDIKETEEIAGYDGYILGCPTYHRDMTEPMNEYEAALDRQPASFAAEVRKCTSSKTSRMASMKKYSRKWIRSIIRRSALLAGIENSIRGRVFVGAEERFPTILEAIRYIDEILAPQMSGLKMARAHK